MPASESACNFSKTIIQDIFGQTLKTPAKRIKERFNYIQADIEEAGLKPTECRLLASINSCMFGNDFAKTSRAKLAQKTSYRQETISRSLKRLKNQYHLVDYENTGRGYIIRLTNFCRAIPKLVRAYGQLGIKKLLELYQQLKTQFEKGDDCTPEVTLDHTRGDSGSHHTIIKEHFNKETAPAPETVREPVQSLPPDPDENQPSAGPFSKSLGEKMDGQMDEIESSCKKILNFPKKSGKAFNPVQAVNWAIKMNYHYKAIAYTINAMADADNWDVIDNPFGWFKAIVISRSKNFNEQDNMQLADDRKFAEQCFTKKFGDMISRLKAYYTTDKTAKSARIDLKVMANNAKS